MPVAQWGWLWIALSPPCRDSSVLSVHSEHARSQVPTGKVKWYDSTKGFGFLTRDDGGEVFVHSSVLPSDATSLRPGQRVE
ncbi:MAG: cold-shock protein, partial [Micromonosporaceae bacterium]